MIYPQDFSDYLNPEQEIWKGYQTLLAKSQKKDLQSFLKLSERLIAEEEAPEDLERVRIGLIHLKNELSVVWEKEHNPIASFFQKAIPDILLDYTEKKAQLQIDVLLLEIEQKVKLVSKSAFEEFSQLRKSFVADVKLNQNSTRLIENGKFRSQAEEFVKNFSCQGRGESNTQLEFLVSEIDRLRDIAGPIIGKKIEGFTQFILKEEEELDFFEAIVMAGKDSMPMFILQLRKITKDENLEGTGKGAFYLINLTGAINKIVGVDI